MVAAVVVAALNGGVLLISTHGTLFSHAPFRTGCPKSRERHRRRCMLSSVVRGLHRPRDGREHERGCREGVCVLPADAEWNRGARGAT